MTKHFLPSIYIYSHKNLSEDQNIRTVPPMVFFRPKSSLPWKGFFCDPKWFFLLLCLGCEGSSCDADGSFYDAHGSFYAPQFFFCAPIGSFCASINVLGPQNQWGHKKNQWGHKKNHTLFGGIMVGLEPERPKAVRIKVEEEDEERKGKREVRRGASEYGCPLLGSLCWIRFWILHILRYCYSR